MILIRLNKFFPLIFFFALTFFPERNFSQTPENLGKNINSSIHEVLPVISADGKTLYFCRRDDYNEMGEIFYSTLNSDNTWSQSENIGAPLNNSDANFVSSASPDGRMLLLGNPNSYIRNGQYVFAAALTHKTDSGWSRPQPLIIRNYYNFSPMIANFLANDGKTLLMSLVRNDSYGGSDIYVSFRENDSVWTAPKNLGRELNSFGDETTPFLSSDGISLYFSSNSYGGYGYNDIFISKRLDSTWEHWSKPQNLGPLVNTNGWDAYYTVPASGEYAYLVSSKNSLGSEDIFRIKLPDSLKPAPVVLVYGRVYNSKDSSALKTKIIYETLPDGKEAGIAYSQTRDGYYSIVLPAGKKYGFRAEAENFIPVSDNLDLRNIKNYQEVKRDLQLVPLGEGATVRINNLFFETGKSELKDESFPELQRLALILKNFPSMQAEISGHTDNVGAAGSNLSLSKNRAQAVADFLVKQGIEKKRLVIKGFGQSKPIASNSDETGRTQNRRVELTIKKK